jgi:hypothetical protein
MESLREAVDDLNPSSRGSASPATADTSSSQQPPHHIVHQSIVGSPANAGLKVKALRKRRKDTLASGGAASRVGKKGSSSVQPFRRRCARARWAALMFLPALFVLFSRGQEVEALSGISTYVSLSAAVAAIGVMVGNEMLDFSPRAVYIVVFCGAFAWGGTIEATKDLIALRLGSMAVLGLCSGMLRYHWGDDGHKIRSGASSASQAPLHPNYISNIPSNSNNSSSAFAGLSISNTAVGGDAPLSEQGGGYSSSSAAYPSTDASQPLRHQSASLQPPASGGPLARCGSSSDPGGTPITLLTQPHVSIETVLSKMLRLVVFLTSHVGLGLTAAVGEVLGCALLVPRWREVLGVSWMGYIAVIVVPVAVFKISSMTSHVLVLLFGSRINTADASRLLLLYWIITTVLGIGILFATVGWMVANIITFVWSLQLLTTPYSIFFELVAYESRRSQAVNPYSEIVEQYGDHITIIRNSKDSYLH